MYNTVGETAGVTQDVGSDPTVSASGFDSGSDFRLGCCFCTLCGVEMFEGGGREGEENGRDLMVFDLSEMSGMEDMGEDGDGEPDTTGSKQEMESYYGGEKKDAKERHSERISVPTHPERKIS